ncbi:MAG: AAA family ATPase [Acidobacteria bacterium]|nr:AAA family ATPase [Acidobacteriota bacterium]
MQVRRFRETTVREALNAVHAALGPDALVLATEHVAARGLRGWFGQRDVQVTAVVPSPSLRPMPAPEARRNDTPAAPPAAASTATSTSGVVSRLVAAGLPQSLAEQAAAQLPPGAHRQPSMQELRKALATQVADYCAGDEPYARLEVFVGPPGVGKTTTVAKLAAQQRARGGAQLGIVAADGFRAGAVEQLRAYASIIGTTFRTARSLDELQEALGGTRQTLLVDTAGRSPRDGGMRDLRKVLQRRKSVRTHLVLAADTSAGTARRIIEAFSEVQPDRLLITKADEAESLMPLLDVANRHGLKVSYVGNGQRVPEDLARATPLVLASALLNEEPGGWESAS